MEVLQISSNYDLIELPAIGGEVTIPVRHLFLGAKTGNVYFENDVIADINRNYMEWLYFKTSGTILDELYNLDLTAFLRPAAVYAATHDAYIVLVQIP